MNNKALEFRKKLASDFIFFDGSMGALLQAAKTKTSWDTPEQLLISEPELIKSIHCDYLEAGATVILTNSFGANKIKLSEYNLDVKTIVTKAVKTALLARESNKNWSNRFVAFNIGPTGKLLEPMGDFSFDEAYEAFKEIAIIAEKCGADLVAIETMSDLYELKAAVLAVKENTKLPIIASATFQDNNLMLTGANVKSLVALLEGLGVDALGFNCGSSLENAKVLAKEFLLNASIPVFVEPNAGLPVLEKGKTVFKVKPKEFSETIFYCASMGARILGGCCGTTPKHIKEVIKACSKIVAKPIIEKNLTVVSSWASSVSIGNNGPVIIGERINPTGKKKLKEALLANDLNYILTEAKNQIEAGANILDVNVGLPGIDEASVMLNAVKLLQKNYDCSLQIDSSEASVIEKSLRYYNGKALVNSVNGKQESMHAIFPLIKKYGGVVVALTLDENGIPSTAEGRVKIAKKIIDTAKTYGINKKDILIDTLTMTVSSQQKEAMETTKAIKIIKEELKVGSVLGVSNISFGLPQRELITSVFFAIALEAGLDACIINPLSEQTMAVYRSFRSLYGYDKNSLEYIDYYSKFNKNLKLEKPLSELESSKTTTDNFSLDLKTIIIDGNQNNAKAATKALLKTMSAVEIIDNCIIPALDLVGKDYENGKKFLPQLLMSAETVSKAFEEIKKHLEKTGLKTKTKGTILLATVQGDIHDIGKNIVKAMLENYGYETIDLGKDAKIEKVLETVIEKKPGIIGLSALMTTTVSNMEKTIKAIRDSNIKTPIMVGGAVLTEDYAYKIGANYYAKDAMDAIKIAKKVFE